MANGLTGDFDGRAELSIPAVSRFLAAMQQSERFLHSVSTRVDDNPPPGSKVSKPVIVGSVYSFDDPMVNHKRIGNSVVFLGQLAATSPIYSALDVLVNAMDVLVNPDALIAAEGTIVPCHIERRRPRSDESAHSDALRTSCLPSSAAQLQFTIQ